MKNPINLFLALSLLAAIWMSCNQQNPQIKIAYVRSGDLIYKYKGMEDATEKYKQQAQGWEANLEALKKEYENAVTKYNQEASKLSLIEKTTREDKIRKMEEHLNKYYQGLQEQAQKKDQELTQDVLEQINKFVEKFGKDNGYAMIFGTSNAGNILYADTIYDLTDTILTGLNKQYADKSATPSDSTSTEK
jgi:outer membrane protein